MLARITAEQSKYRVGTPGLSANATRWLQQLAVARGQPPAAQLVTVNRIVNENRYRADPSRKEEEPSTKT